MIYACGTSCSCASFFLFVGKIAAKRNDKLIKMLFSVGDESSNYNEKYVTPHDKTNKMAHVPSEDSDQPGHPPSLIGVFAVRSVGN